MVAASEKEHPGTYDAPEPNVWGDSLHYQDFGHSHWHNSLIWGDSLVNISILGPGMIWGKGLYRESKVPEGGGNKAIALKNCRNVNIRDISMLYCGHFAVLATGCDNMTFDNLKIDSQRDGINIDCCVNVRISNCSVNTPLDDAICLKSSFALGYARATENVTITNCNVTGYHTGTMLNGERKKEGSASHGRIKMGTESNGGFKNITISNCVFERCRGLALETVDGGLLEDVTISNITLRDVSNTPFFIRLGARMRGPEDVPVGELRRVIISNVVVYDADVRYGVIISGIPGHPIKDLMLNNVRIYYEGGGTGEMAAIVPEEQETGYPDPRAMGEMPSYGFFIRHVENVTLNDIQISTITSDQRPPFVLNDVQGADFFRVGATKEEGLPMFQIQDSGNINFEDCEGVDNQFIPYIQSTNL